MPKASVASGGNGGIAGSGIFGMFGTIINCSSTDNSLYCNFMKLFNILIVLLIIGYVIYFAYNLFSGSSKRGGGRR
jgi:cytochrome bd-type quinol oxidase subunit 2